MSDIKSVPAELLLERRQVTSQVFEGIRHASVDGTDGSARSRTPGKAKNYFEFLDLVSKALKDYQTRQGVPEEKMITLSWESPDLNKTTETIAIGLVKRVPGSFAEGSPFEGSVQNLRPILREVKQDSNHPGYRNLYLGYIHDNLIQFTCWALTNKEAITRSFWFEDFMNKYTWFFRVSGVARVLFMEQSQDIFTETEGKKFYGRPLNYFVRTETIDIISEKQIEEIGIDISVGQM